MAEYVVEFPDGTDMSQFDRIYGIDFQLVRCKDCKHWIGGGIDDNDNFIPPRCTLFNEPQTANWFCPEGEHK